MNSSSTTFNTIQRTFTCRKLHSLIEGISCELSKQLPLYLSLIQRHEYPLISTTLEPELHMNIQEELRENAHITTKTEPWEREKSFYNMYLIQLSSWSPKLRFELIQSSKNLDANY